MTVNAKPKRWYIKGVNQEDETGLTYKITYASSEGDWQPVQGEIVPEGEKYYDNIIAGPEIVLHVLPENTAVLLDAVMQISEAGILHETAEYEFQVAIVQAFLAGRDNKVEVPL